MEIPEFASEEEEAAFYERLLELEGQTQMNQKLANEWLKEALSEEEFAMTVGIDPAILADLYEDILHDGPYAYSWYEYLSYLETVLDFILHDDSVISQEAREIYNTLLSTYKDFPDFWSNLYTLATDNWRISNFWIDAGSYNYNLKVPLCRVIFHSIIDDPKLSSFGLSYSQIEKPVEQFSTYILMQEIIKENVDSNDPALIKHYEFMETLKEFAAKVK